MSARAIQQEEPLRPLFVRLGQVAVAFVSRDGTVMKESNLKIEAVAWHEAAQPRRGVLPGITRSVVLEICQTLGLPTNKRVIKPEALRNSEGIFITQSALGIVPVTTLDGEPVAPPPLLDPVLRAYHEMLAKP